MPELSLALDQPLDELVVASDAIHAQLVATDQAGHVGSLLARDRQLVLDLKLDVLRHAIAPKFCSVDAGRFAFKKLNVVDANCLTVDVRQHPRVLRMLENGVDTPNLVTGSLRVRDDDHGFQQRAPEHRRGVVVGVDLFMLAVLAGLDQKKLKGRAVRVYTYNGWCIAAADPLVADIQPLITGQAFDLD
jgi:hypothetical protein